VLNHQQTIESEIGEIDEEEEECEATVRALALDLNEKEQHLGRCLAAEARELEKVRLISLSARIYIDLELLSCSSL